MRDFFFSTASMLLAMVMVRGGGRQEAEATACLAFRVIAEEPGESSRKGALHPSNTGGCQLAVYVGTAPG